MPMLSPSISHFRTEIIQSQGIPIALSLLERDPAATTVLFYPGTVSSPLMYSIFLYELFALGVNVLGIHPLSHGLSPRQKKDFTFDDILQNGKDAESFAHKYFSGPLVLCGHSQGGILALAHSINNKSIKACFPISTLLPHNDNAASVTRLAFIAHHKQKLLAKLRSMAKIFPLLPIPFWMYLDHKRILAHGYKMFSPEKNCRSGYPLSFIANFFNQDLSQAEQMGNISCPFFLLTARNDMLFPLSLMQDTLERIQVEQKKLIIIEGGGHLCPLSQVYAKQMAAHVVAECAGLGLYIHINTESPQ